MSKTRNNHYVPRWYQEGFFEPGGNTLRYLDMRPREHALADGRVVTEKALFDAPTSRAFLERDLYTTFFGASVNDEIERKLFGAIDTRGSSAIRAFTGDDVSQWHHHFQTLFEYIDIQKIRTPKGLDWLKAQYPSLTQNDLMLEMQGIRMMHCTIWTEGVREIVSAKDANVKFIVSDHPVTIYNHAVDPQHRLCAYPSDPAIALKASQTIFPLNRDFCLILTNLEYVENPAINPLEKRTFARNFRSSIVRTDAFIRTRKLSDLDVTRINFILKARARRYIAADRDELLYPEKVIDEPWQDLRKVLLPQDETWRFGGELFVGYDDGRVHYQDAFGRTEKPSDALLKAPKLHRPKEPCGCGSGKRFMDCCKPKPPSLRPIWLEPSIRERNLILYRAVVDILRLNQGRDWTQVRRDLSDEQIKEVYRVNAALWPLETDLLQLLPKPDGCPRAIYTGAIHPLAIVEFALGASLYFGELIVESPFVHARTLKSDFSPVENPKAFRQEFLKSALLFLTIMPLVEQGVVNLIPDPCNFDFHLRDQMYRMARRRSPGLERDAANEDRLRQLVDQDFRRSVMSLPRDALRQQLRNVSPEPDEARLDNAVRLIERAREQDPLAVLQEDSFEGGREGGLLHMMKLAPNFEIAMYLAQATGACIVTDSLFRWNEIRRAIRRPEQAFLLPALSRAIAEASFHFPLDVQDILRQQSDFSGYPALMRGAFKYLTSVDRKPNFEAHLASRFGKTHATAQDKLEKKRLLVSMGKISCAFPVGGIQDNTVNRLLLMSSSEHHLPSVPMAFFIDRFTPSKPSA